MRDRPKQVAISHLKNTENSSTNLHNNTDTALSMEKLKEELFRNLVNVLHMDAWWEQQGGNRMTHKIPKDIIRVKNMLMMHVPAENQYATDNFSVYHSNMDKMKMHFGSDYVHALTVNKETGVSIYQELQKISEQYHMANQNVQLHFVRIMINDHHDDRADIYKVFGQLHDAMQSNNLNVLNALNKQLETFIQDNEHQFGYGKGG